MKVYERAHTAQASVTISGIHVSIFRNIVLKAWFPYCGSDPHRRTLLRDRVFKPVYPCLGSPITAKPQGILPSGASGSLTYFGVVAAAFLQAFDGGFHHFFSFLAKELIQRIGGGMRQDHDFNPAVFCAVGILLVKQHLI